MPLVRSVKKLRVDTPGTDPGWEISPVPKALKGSLSSKPSAIYLMELRWRMASSKARRKGQPQPLSLEQWMRKLGKR